MEVQIALTIVDLFKFFGTPVFVGIIVSFLLERVPAFQALETNTKAFTALFLAVLCALGSRFLLATIPASVIAALDPLYADAVNMIIAFIASQVWHRLIQKETAVALPRSQLTVSDDPNKA